MDYVQFLGEECFLRYWKLWRFDIDKRKPIERKIAEYSIHQTRDQTRYCSPNQMISRIRCHQKDVLVL